MCAYVDSWRVSVLVLISWKQWRVLCMTACHTHWNMVMSFLPP